MKWTEDNTAIDYKIITSATACAITAFSQLYKPDPSWEFQNALGVQFTCIGMYGALMAFYYYIEYIMMGDTFYVSKAHTMKKANKHPNIMFNSKIQEGSDLYELEIKTSGKNGKKVINLS